jgi:hypothetical protein
MYGVQKDVWHLTGLDKTIVEQILRWSNNLFNVGTYESRQRYFKSLLLTKHADFYGDRCCIRSFSLARK